MRKPDSKKDKAIRLVNKEVAAGRNRQQILAKLQSRLEMTPGGAQNYYQRIMTGAWKADAAAVAAARAQ